MFFSKSKIGQNIFLYERLRVFTNDKCKDLKILDYPISVKIKENEVIFFIKLYGGKKNPEEIKINLDNINEVDVFIRFYSEKLEFNDKIYTKIPTQLFYSRFLNIEENKNKFLTKIFKRQNNKEAENHFRLSELFLDFLYDFFYTDTFKQVPYYKEVKVKLLNIKFIQFLKAKYDYLLTRDSLPNSITHRKNTRRWLELLQSDEAERFITKTNLWFDDLHKEIQNPAFDIARYFSDTDMYEKAFDWEIANLQYWQSWKMLALKNRSLLVITFLLISSIISFLVIFLFKMKNFCIAKILFLTFLALVVVLFLDLIKLKNNFKDLIKLLSFEVIITSNFFWFSFNRSFDINIPTVLIFLLLIFLVFLFYSIDKKISFLNSIIIIVISFFYTYISGFFIMIFFPEKKIDYNFLNLYSFKTLNSVAFLDYNNLLFGSLIGLIISLITFIITKLRIKTRL